MFRVENRFDEFRNRLINNINIAAQEIKVVTVADIKSNTPVKSGDLKKSIKGEVNKSDKNNKNIKVEVGSKLVYARKVELLNTSYIRTTMKANEEKINLILNKYIRRASE